MILETMEPESYLGPTRYRHRFRCERCSHEFSRISTKVNVKTPECPKKACREASIQLRIQAEAERLAKMLEDQRAPAQVGDKPIVKAIDTTAKIVMEDHHLSDLKDNIRQGDVAAPSLPPAQQRAADNFFKGGGELKKRQMDLMGRRAIAGAFRGMAVNPAMISPGAKRGQTPLVSVSMERNNAANDKAK